MNRVYSRKYAQPRDTAIPVAEPERMAEFSAARPMVGLFCTLTPEQRRAVLAYRGPENLVFPESGPVAGAGHE